MMVIFFSVCVYVCRKEKIYLLLLVLTFCYL